MSVKNQIDKLLQKPMSRQQFLKTSFVALLAVVGVSRVFDALKLAEGAQGPAKQTAGPAKHAGSAYGMSVYEGVKR